MTIAQEEILNTLNKLLKQRAYVRRGTDAVYFCPICDHYKRKLEINLKNGKYHCWTCNFSGKSFGSLLRKLNASAEYYAVLGESREVPAHNLHDIFSPKPLNPHQLFLPKEFISLSNPSRDFEQKHAIKYLKNRQISDVDIMRYNIGYCPYGDFQGRIVIPSYDAHGQLNFFSGRSFYEDCKLKYRLCNGTKNIIGFESHINFNEDIVLVEGQFDALAVKRNAIPLFGKTMSRLLKAKLLENKPRRINILLDNDALKDAIAIAEYLLSNGLNIYLVNLNGKDPSEIGFHNTWECIKNTRPTTFESLLKLKLSL